MHSTGCIVQVGGQKRTLEVKFFLFSLKVGKYRSTLVYPGTGTGTGTGVQPSRQGQKLDRINLDR